MSARRLLVFFAFVLTCGPLLDAQPEPPGSGPWIARQVQDRDTGRDSRFAMTMRLLDRRGRVRERQLDFFSLRGTESGRRADRVLMRFRYPADIRGTGFLVIEHPAADDERFLYLPALGRVRRIAGEEKQDSFVGSDFTYEDMGGRELDDYTYTALDVNAAWTSPKGETRPAWKLESRAKDVNATYPRVVSLVLKDSFVVVAAENYNRRGEVAKQFEVRSLEQVSGIWTALELVMRNLRDRTSTELTVTKAEYNVGLEEADFSRRALEREAR
jgi:hypothetical protein